MRFVPSTLALAHASLVPLGPVLLGTAVSQAQTIEVNTRQVGFADLSPAPTSTKGLWAYEAGGRRFCLQTRGSLGLAILDMTDPRGPFLADNVAGNFRKVAVSGDLAYATTDSGPTVIVDLSDPDDAQVVGSMSTGAHTLRIGGDRLYLNQSGGGLRVYDLGGDPLVPQQLGSWSGYAHDCRPAGDVVYVNGFQTDPTRILDVSDPSNIVEIGVLPAGTHSSALYRSPAGDRVLATCDETVGGHVMLFDVDDPGAPTLLGSYQASPSASVHNVEIKGAYAYVAYYQDQLRVLDLRDPTSPVEVGVWDNNPTNFGSTYSDAWEAIPMHDAVYVNQMFDTSSGPAGTHAIDFFPGFGQGAAGTGGVVPEIWWSFGPASPGNGRFAVRLEGALPNTTAKLLMGTSRTSWNGLPLPRSLAELGFENATLYVSPDLVWRVTTDANGEATLALPVPKALKGATFYVQWAVRDPGAPNTRGWSFSRAGELVVW